MNNMKAEIRKYWWEDVNGTEVGHLDYILFQLNKCLLLKEGPAQQKWVSSHETNKQTTHTF
jgi:hypothetical protein